MQYANHLQRKPNFRLHSRPHHMVHTMEPVYDELSASYEFVYMNKIMRQQKQTNGLSISKDNNGNVIHILF